MTETNAAQTELDLTPRQVSDQATGRTKRRWLPAAILAVVVAGLGFVLLQTLGDASLFFYNADEAVERRGELVDKRFRVQGTPFGEPINAEVDRAGRLDVAVVFPISFDGQIVDVIHTGSPAELFQPGVPVVLEGTWVQGLPEGIGPVSQGANDGWHFASTDMVVKHDNDYRNDNGERINDAEQGGFVPDS